MTFPNVQNLRLWTNEEFLNLLDEDFHHSATPLSIIPNFNFITGVPLDYLHAVCLGVTRSIINTWVGSQRTHQCKLPASVIILLSNKLTSLSSYIPCEFNRKPRSFVEVKRWKGTEFRQFLLYTGPVILQESIRALNKGAEIYSHFLCLFIPMFILLNPNLCHKYQNYARDLLVHFVRKTKSLYGEKYLTHNFHCLLHIADDVSTFGPLDNCSPFKFENYLQTFKKHIRKGSKPLQQVVKRITEQMETSLHEFKDSNLGSNIYHFGQHCNGPMLNLCDPFRQYT
uniref:Uncharacterized protein n=1 Tax=Cacopsylla melanoneura TaxID=428564 RepID=A0A8D9F003_9HEMI